MRIEELKENIGTSIGLWSDKLLTDLATDNPRLSVASVYLKKGIRNLANREKERIDHIIDNAALFICDDNGELNLRTVFNDLMGVFNEMDEMPFGFGFFRGTIGKGNIRIQLPDSMLTSILFGDLGCVKITEADLRELVDILES